MEKLERMVNEHKGVKHGDIVSLDVLALTQAVENVIEAKRVVDGELSGLDKFPDAAPHFRNASKSLKDALELVEAMFDSWADNKLDQNLKKVVRHINKNIGYSLFKPHLVDACRLAQRMAHGEYNVPVEAWDKGLTDVERMD